MESSMNDVQIWILTDNILIMRTSMRRFKNACFLGLKLALNYFQSYQLSDMNERTNRVKTMKRKESQKAAERKMF
jgi:hypothetical protein